MVISLLAILLSLVLTGCWGRREVDEQAFVLAIGLDKGRENQILVTYQIAIPRIMGGGGGEGRSTGGGSGSGDNNKPVLVTSIESPSLFVSIDMVNTYIHRRASLMHTKAIVVSEELAREKGVGTWVPGLLRFREARRDVLIMVARGSAKDFIENNQPMLDKNVNKYYELLSFSQYYTGFIPRSWLYDFANAIKSKGENPVAILVGVNRTREEALSHDTSQASGPGKRPGQADEQSAEKQYVSEGSYLAGDLPRTGGNKVEFMGSAVFKKDRMVGTINGDETIVLMMLRGEFRRGFISLRDPRQPDMVIPLDVTLGRLPLVKVRLVDGRPEIQVTLQIEADILGVQSGINYADPELIPELEQAFSQKIEDLVRKLIARSQNEFDADIFGFGNKAARLFWTWDEWERFDWPSKFRTAEIKVAVKTRIRRTGLQIKTMPLRG